MKTRSRSARLLEILQNADSDVDLDDDDIGPESEPESDVENSFVSHGATSKIPKLGSRTIDQDIIGLKVATKKEIIWDGNARFFHQPTSKFHFNPIDNHHSEVDNQTPYEIWNKYITDDFIERMVKYTNEYGVDKDPDFPLCSKEEMERFLGVSYFMGCYHVTSVKTSFDRIHGI